MAKCGNRSGEETGAAASLIAGVVVIRKSPRSLYRPRSPTTEMFAEAVIVNTPWSAGSDPPPAQGNWLRNSAICWFAGIVSDEVASGAPLSVLRAKLICTGVDEEFAMAIPD